MALRADLAQAGQRLQPRYNRDMYKVALTLLVVVLVALQYRLWIADGGWAEVHRISQLKQELHEQNVQASARNDAMQAEVDDLKSGESATEGRARSDIGMIKQDETFFLTVAPPNGATGDSTQASR